MEPGGTGNIVSLDNRNMTMKIQSQYREGDTYDVSMHRCDCHDFERRKLPCKHMYRLALELGVVSPHWDLSGLPSEWKTVIDSLSDNQKKSLYRFLWNNGNTSRYFHANPQKAFVKCNIVEEEPLQDTLNRDYTKSDLANLLPGDSPVKKEKKADIVEHIVQNEEKIARTLAKKHRKVKYSDSFAPYHHYARRYLGEMYG